MSCVFSDAKIKIMALTNVLKDINGIEIKEGQDIIYVNNPDKIFKVIREENNLGHTEKFKRDNICYQSFLGFLEADNLTTFRVL